MTSKKKSHDVYTRLPRLNFRTLIHTKYDKLKNHKNNTHFNAYYVFQQHGAIFNGNQLPTGDTQ